MEIKVKPRLIVATDADCVVVEFSGVRARVTPATAVYAAEFARGVASRPDYVDQDCLLDVSGSLKLECVKAPDNPPIWRRNRALRLVVEADKQTAATIVTQSELGLLALALERAALLAAETEA